MTSKNLQKEKGKHHQSVAFSLQCIMISYFHYTNALWSVSCGNGKLCQLQLLSLTPAFGM